MNWWTEERTELAKKHHAEGLSGTQSAAILGTTRNSVLGKWGRLGLLGTRPKSPPQPRPRSDRRKYHYNQTARAVDKMKKGEPVRSIAPEEELEAIESALCPDEIPRHQRRTMETLGERHCRWPYGQPGGAGFFFCGSVAASDRVPYCPMHCRVAYNGYGRATVGRLARL